MPRIRPLKIARILVVVYALSLTALILAAFTIGPFKESVSLWAKIRTLESDLRESRQKQKSFEEERRRLLIAVKNLRADWTNQQETVRALRGLVKNPESEQRLMEANRLAEKLSQERSVLIAKLNQLRQEIQARDDDPEKAELKAKLAAAEAELAKLKGQ